MPNFFIERPVFAWVIALFIVLGGALSIPNLPIAQFPSVAPPSIIITASYPGASPDTMNTSVISLIEREITGLDNLLYFESSSDTSGMGTITVTFKPGTDIKLAQADLQNQIKSIEARLPLSVRQNGLNFEAANSGFLMIVGLKSKSGNILEADLSDYFARNVADELRRVPGVGKVQLFGSEKALRIWLDPLKLRGYGISASDVITAVSQQNMEVTPGRTGDEPAVDGQPVSFPVTIKGQLTSKEEFENITLLSKITGMRLKLSDIARVESGLQSYAFSSRENGVPAAAAAIQLSPQANAISTSNGIRSRLSELETTLPEDMEFTIPFDTTPFVEASIKKVIQTFIEAMALVFLVMLLFLHKIRCTIIPAIVAPIALLGTTIVMLISGYSINILTMFGMILAIGIIVDDAIVVVENVERIIETQNLSPIEATHKAMKEITPAIIGITLVLSAVFIPLAFSAGSVGIMYRQFCISIAVSILFSAFLALTLTPALCASILKNSNEKSRFSLSFNKNFDKLVNKYKTSLLTILPKRNLMVVVYFSICLILYFGFHSIPSSFLPEEDQGYFMSSIQLPAEATSQRTLSVVKEYEKELESRPGIKSNITLMGFSFSGSGSNSAMTFTTLKDWDHRIGITAQSEADHMQSEMDKIPGAVTMSLLPPAISDMGTSSGFTYYIQDVAGNGYQALKKAADELILKAKDNKKLSDVYIDGLPEGQSLTLNIDREKAEAMGVSFNEINDAISILAGSRYVNDYENKGRIQQVIVQSDSQFRMQPDHLLNMPVKNKTGQVFPLSAFANISWSVTPQQINRYQGYPAIRIMGSAAPGESSGTAMREMAHLSKTLPNGFRGAWSGSSLQEMESEAQLPWLIGLSTLVVFMVLAALYESWSIPLAVMLVVPLGLIGSVSAVLIADLQNDAFFKVGLITLIGLSAKNSILIVEFAKQLHLQGKTLFEATVTAAQLRLRPILMTSLAFALGVIPMMFATGASDKTQQSIGTGVFGGMISGTILTLFFAPLFFVITSLVTNKIKAVKHK